MGNLGQILLITNFLTRVGRAAEDGEGEVGRIYV